MKKVVLSFLGFATVLSLSLTSCADPCKDVDCNNGECVEGNCICDDGYEGTNCDVEWATKFLALNANATDICVSGSYNYTVDIDRINEATIQITNLGDFNIVSQVYAIISNGTDITMTNFTDNAGRTWNATGSINNAGTTLTINYVVTFDDGTTDTCTTTISL